MGNRRNSNRLYRSREGGIFGVCQGISDWKGIDAGYLRLGLVVATLFTGFFPLVILYLAAGIFLPVKPRYRG